MNEYKYNSVYQLTKAVRFSALQEDHSYDFDGDSNFDFVSDTTGNASYTYTLANDYNAVIRVTNSNNVSSIKTIPISVAIGISTTLSQGGFDPVLGESISINSVLTQGAKITLRVVDRNQNPVKTIVSNVNRETGFYSDNWDGRDDLGNLVKVGIYYFIIDYEINGKKYTYNLTNTIGDNSVSSFDYPATYSPYDGRLCTMKYTLDNSAEITIYVFWSPGVGQNPQYVIKTIYLREAQKAGTYIAVWDGANSDGVIAPAGSYVFSIIRINLAKNAIIVSGRPVISDMTMSTHYFSPGMDLNKNVRMNFRLSKPVKLKIIIRDTLGIIVNETEISGVESGLQNISWNGLGRNGNLVKSGKYSLGVQAIDAAGNTSDWVYGALQVFY